MNHTDWYLFNIDCFMLIVSRIKWFFWSGGIYNCLALIPWLGGWISPFRNAGRFENKIWEDFLLCRKRRSLGRSKAIFRNLLLLLHFLSLPFYWHKSEPVFDFLSSSWQEVGKNVTAVYHPLTLMECEDPTQSLLLLVMFMGLLLWRKSILIQIGWQNQCWTSFFEMVVW